MWHGRKENLEQGQSSPSTFFSGAEGITIFLLWASPYPRADVAARRLAGSAASSSPPPRRTRLCFAVFSRRRFAFLRFSIVTCTSPPPLTAAVIFLDEPAPSRYARSSPFLDSHGFPPYLFAFLLHILCQRRRRWVWFPVVAVAASRAADSRCGRCPLRRMLGSTRDFLGSCVVFLLR